MVKALLGKKVGMTQVFDAEGVRVPVTVLQVGPCFVVQLKCGTEGSCKAVQIGFGERKRKNTTRPLLGHFDKAGVEPRRVLRDVEPEEGAELEPGQSLGAGVFAQTAFVHITGTSKGRGFAGVMKRHGFAGGPASHGCSKRHRHPGSIGTNTDPGRVLKGRKMGGHMGVDRVTVRNLKVVKVDEARNLILVRGAVPGFNGSYLLVRKARAASAKA